VTGRRLPDVEPDVHVRQEQLDAVYRDVFGEDDFGDGGASRRNCPAHSPAATARSISTTTRSSGWPQASAARAPNSPHCGAGNWNAHFNSPSEADSSVVFTLAFYTKDAAQIDRLFRTSGLMRDKWDELHGGQTYGETTIAKALEKVATQYTPKRTRKRLRSPSQPPSNPRLPSSSLTIRSSVT